MFSNPDIQAPLQTACLPLRAIHPLQDSQIVALERAIRGMPRRWSLERHESYDGNRLIMLVSTDEMQETLIVSRSTNGFDLTTNSGDEFQSVGCFASLADLMAVLESLAPSATRIAEVIARR